MAADRKQHSKRSTRTLLWIVGVAGGILLGLVVLWFITRNTTVYSADKQQVKLKVQSALDAADFQGKPIYTSLDDVGCDDRNSVGVAYYGHCDVLGQKYFKGSGDLGSYLREADKKLIASGWQRDSDSDFYDKVFSGTRASQLQYKKDGNFLKLFFYRDNSWNSSFDIRKLLDDGKIPPLKDGEFVYGVYDNTAYWSCHWDSFFKQPCILPAKG